jgi:hypothetical protein
MSDYQTTVDTSDELVMLTEADGRTMRQVVACYRDVTSEGRYYPVHLREEDSVPGDMFVLTAEHRLCFAIVDRWQ